MAELKKIARVFLALRHTEKGGPAETGSDLPGHVIGQVGRKRLNELKLPDRIRLYALDMFGSGLLRTFQCMLQLAVTHRLNGIPHDPLLDMGNDALFNDWIERGLRDATKQTGSLCQGIEKILNQTGPADFNLACQKCGDAIEFAFSVMDSEYGLGVFHSPTIEMAGLALGGTFAGQLHEDEGMIFIQLEDETVRKYGQWKSGDPVPKHGDVLPV